MPTDTLNTFQLPYRPDQQRDSVAVDKSAPGHYERPDFELNQQRPLYEKDFSQAAMTEAERAEDDATLNLNEDLVDDYHPEVFDRMNHEAHQADSYYTQKRESVAHAQHVESPTFTPEMATQSIKEGLHLDRAVKAAERLEYERDQMVLAA